MVNEGICFANDLKFVGGADPTILNYKTGGFIYG